MKPGRLSTLVGVAVVGLAVLGAGRQLQRAVSRWDQLGPLPAGGPTPRFEVLTMAGATFDHDDLQGKVSVLTFWATWCSACVSELGDLEDLQHEYSGADVQFLAINHDGGLSAAQAAAKVQGFIAERDMTLPTAIDDGTVARRFRVGPIPHTLVLGRDGVVRHIHQGRVMSSTLRDEIDGLVAAR